MASLVHHRGNSPSLKRSEGAMLYTGHRSSAREVKELFLTFMEVVIAVYITREYWGGNQRNVGW